MSSFCTKKNIPHQSCTVLTFKPTCILQLVELSYHTETLDTRKATGELCPFWRLFIGSQRSKTGPIFDAQKPTSMRQRGWLPVYHALFYPWSSHGAAVLCSEEWSQEANFILASHALELSRRNLGWSSSWAYTVAAGRPEIGRTLEIWQTHKGIFIRKIEISASILGLFYAYKIFVQFVNMFKPCINAC